MKEEVRAMEIADLIRARSSTRKLTALADIEAESNCPGTDRLMEPAQTLIQDVTSRHDDIKAVIDSAGHPFYYSERFMTGAYAGVLLLKGEGLLRMMAEVIREQSRIYPRPVPVALFQCSPFDLSEDQISVGLKEMLRKSPYRDIAQLTTSTGALFVYSTNYLDLDHASMLAEWIDVGQAENP
jgi:hypothetical protein